MNILPTKILLATDGSEDAGMAARAAVDLSNKTGAELHVVHAWKKPREYAYPGMSQQSYILTYVRQAERILNEELERIEQLGGTVTEAHFETRRAADAVLDLSGEIGADLMILGSRGLGSFKRVTLGSVSDEIVHHASCPVLVVRGGEHTWPPERIVIGDDGSDNARRAGDLAVGLGKLLGVPMVLVRAYHEPVAPMELSTDQLDLHDRMVERNLEEDAQALQGRAEELESTLGVRPETKLSSGNPAVVLDKAAGEDHTALVAVGSRGQGTVRRMALGSVSTKILRAAKGPVLIYPHSSL